MGQKGDRQQGHSERKPDASSGKPSDDGRSKQKKLYTMHEARAFIAQERVARADTVADDPASPGPSGDAVYQAPSFNLAYCGVVTDRVPGFGDA